MTTTMTGELPVNSINARLRRPSWRVLTALLGAVAVIAAGIGLHVSGALATQASGKDTVRTAANTVNQGPSHTDSSDASSNAGLQSKAQDTVGTGTLDNTDPEDSPYGFYQANLHDDWTG